MDDGASYYLDYLSNFYPTWDRDLAADLVRQLQLPPDRKLKHLSRGMRMKAALASSLAYRPKLIVLDEPFTGLDALVRDELIEGLLARAENTTILISSHDLAEIESFASHVGYLERGPPRLLRRARIAQRALPRDRRDLRGPSGPPRPVARCVAAPRDLRPRPPLRRHAIRRRPSSRGFCRLLRHCVQRDAPALHLRHSRQGRP